MGIHTDYDKEYRRAWIYYAISIITVNSLEIISLVLYEIYLDGATGNTYLSIPIVVFDVLQISVSSTITVNLHLLLRNIYIRFAALNQLLRYSDLICSFSYRFS